jgi:hypothetical protein
MAFAVTARQSAANAGTATASLTTGSATPTANSLFIAAYGCQIDNGAAELPNLAPPTGGSLTYTLIDKHGDVTALEWGNGTGFCIGGRVDRAPIGGSPSAFAVTVDGASAPTNGYHSAVCLDITGHNTTTPIVSGQVARNGARINPQSDTASGTVTLASTPTAGNLIVVVFVCGVDGAGAVASPTAGAGKTFTTVTALSAAFCTTAVFYRVADGAESATITCSDLGQQCGNYVAIAFEVAAASGGGNSLTQSPADTEGLTDAAALSVGKALSDNLGLTDAGISRVYDLAVSHTLGLADSATVERGLSQAPTDPLGLTDALRFDTGKGVADSEGLTDTATPASNRALAPADTEGLTDTAALSAARDMQDALGLSDSAQVQLSASGSLTPSDTEGLTDSTAMDVGKVVPDVAGLSDSAQVALSAAGSLNLTDNEALTDSAALTAGKSLADSLGLTDSVQVDLFRQLSVTASDTETLTDTVTLARLIALNFSDTESLTDLQTFSVSAVQGDTLGLTDNAQAQAVTVRSYDDLMGLADSVVLQLGPAVPARDLSLTGKLQTNRFSGALKRSRFEGKLRP